MSTSLHPTSGDKKQKMDYTFDEKDYRLWESKNLQISNTAYNIPEHQPLCTLCLCFLNCLVKFWG